MPHLPDSAASNSTLARWTWILIAAGVALRVAQFATNRSLWFDEAMLALNVLHRPWSGILQPLDYHQGAPPGFILLEKSAARLLGNCELALRTVPLAAGVSALLIFRQVARLYLCRRAALLAVALLALSFPLIYYSSEVKQYSSDVLFVLIMMWMSAQLAGSQIDARKVVPVGLLGAAAIWFSHPVSLVLAGVGTVLALVALRQRDWAKLRQLCGITAFWLVSFVLCYFLYLRQLSADRALLDFWQGYFPPHPLLSWEVFPWLLDRFFGAFSDVSGLTPVLGAALSVAGCWSLWRRNKIACLLLTAPIVMVTLAALVHKYPLGNRLLLFVCPILLLLVAEGAIWAAGKARRMGPIAEAVVIALVLAQPLVMSAWNLWHPARAEDIKPDIHYIVNHQKPGDVWYVYHFARYQFQYYSEQEKLPTADIRIGKDCGKDPACYAGDLDQLRGMPRVWILFSHIWTGDGVDEERLFLDNLDSLGTRLDSYRSTGARAYLYDLSTHKR